MYAPPVQRLITELSKLPGVGGRTAQRLAFHILRASDEEAFALADAIREVKQRIGLCEVCFNLADGPRCRICDDERRDPELICVVEEPSDVISIERTHEFARALPRARRGAVADRRGRPRGPEDRRAVRAGQAIAEPVREVVIATNPDHHRRGDRAAHRRRPARAAAGHLGHPPGQRAAGRRRPGVRRRAHAGPGVVRPPRGASTAYPVRPWPFPTSETVVMKFGGTSVADAERIKARRAPDRRPA